MTYMLVFKRYAPFETFGFGFEGDKRTAPSSKRGATARTIGVVEFTQTSVSSKILGYSSGSRWFSDAPLTYSDVTAKVSTQTASGSAIAFTASTAGALPLIPGAPDIDTFVDLHAKFSPIDIAFSGKVRGDTFPNAEVWVYDGTATAKHALLFDFRTGGNRDTGPFGLAGSHEKTILGRFQIIVPIDSSGKFVRNASPSNFVQGP